MRVHRELGHAARLWDAGGREPSDLYRGARLAAARELPAELNATERAFLEASIDEADRERRTQARTNRRLRALLAAASVLLLVAIGAGVLSLVQRDNALDAQSAAEAQSLTSDAERVGALALSEPTLELSLLMATTGVTLEDRVETRGNLLDGPPAEPGRGPRSAAVERSRSAPSRPAPTAACSRAATPAASSGSPTCAPGGRAGRRSSSRSRWHRRRCGSRPTAARWRWARATANRAEVHLVDVATRRCAPDRRVAGTGGHRRHVVPEALARFRARRPPPRRRPGHTGKPARTGRSPSGSCSSTPTPAARYGGGAIRSGAGRWRPTCCSGTTVR